MTPDGASTVISERILRVGPIGFDEFVELALYAPGAGFYATGGVAGRSGDFLTSPEVGPLFGAVLARALDAWWEALGAPDPFVVVEAAAGSGALARDVLAAEPRCGPALRYLMVERSDTIRELQPATVPVEPAGDVLGPMSDADDDDGDGPAGLPGRGPRVASLGELPVGPLTGVVLANELLDNLAFSLLERAVDAWWEVRVGVGGRGEGFVEVLTPAPPALSEVASRLAPAAVPGARIPVQTSAATWLRDALRLLHRGRVVVVDYGATTPELAQRPQGEWLRTYRRGGPGGPPLERPGTQDITCEVCEDQLARVWQPDVARHQASFLEEHGIGELVDRARVAWQQGAAAGTMASLRARSRMTEAAALTDPAGLGGFRVLEFVKS